MRSRLLLAVLLPAFAATSATASAATPNAVTGTAQSVTVNTALLNGTVDPNGNDTSYYFQYGTSTGYGAKTATRSAGNGDGNIGVQLSVAGLAANTAYHYRIVAVGGGTTIRGADRIFRTLPVIVPEPSKLELARATINMSARWIDVLAPISARASGIVNLELFGAHQVHRWTAPISSSDGRILDRESIPAAQASLGTGILTISYRGDADTRPQVVRLRAANNPANLDSSRPTIVNGHLLANGTIDRAARGIVRVQLEYFSGGRTTTLEKTAAIANGGWRLDALLSPVEQAGIATRRGTVHSYILFTGYLPAKMRGEMQAYEVLGAQ